MDLCIRHSLSTPRTEECKQERVLHIFNVPVTVSAAVFPRKDVWTNRGLLLCEWSRLSQVIAAINNSFFSIFADLSDALKIRVKCWLLFEHVMNLMLRFQKI